jgi:hypothetical protein
MPDAPEQLHGTLRTFAEHAGYTLTDDDIEGVAAPVKAARERMAALRRHLDIAEEPAAVFSTPAGMVE